ncbi:hypothetical protein R6Q59_034574 [Mikania micrantha]|uniref:Uncharacterized protein n=1 Tax=Mikania micrantha TaxID=192012 RepID=A0A5N6NH43_9ASTR|nr:hypothetical protein E3N88_20465 [Mikania micrantha]
MAIDLCSDNSSGITSSPRISFSYDLSQSDTVPVEQLLRSISSSSVDFNFCVQENSGGTASMADELFSDGKILPTQVKSKSEAYKRSPVTPLPRRKTENLKPPALSPPEDDELKHQSSKSFWGFKRSSSCGNGYARSLCPITLLSRSHSTGSSTSSKRSSSSSSSKEAFNQKHHRSFQKPSVSQKPPLRKSGYGYGNSTATTTNNGIRVNPVLNLGGFGSLFSSNIKNKNKK